MFKNLFKRVPKSKKIFDSKIEELKIWIEELKSNPIIESTSIEIAPEDFVFYKFWVRIKIKNDFIKPIDNEIYEDVSSYIISLYSCGKYEKEPPEKTHCSFDIVLKSGKDTILSDGRRWYKNIFTTGLLNSGSYLAINRHPNQIVSCTTSIIVDISSYDNLSKSLNQVINTLQNDITVILNDISKNKKEIEDRVEKMNLFQSKKEEIEDCVLELIDNNIEYHKIDYPNRLAYIIQYDNIYTNESTLIINDDICQLFKTLKKIKSRVDYVIPGISTEVKFSHNQIEINFNFCSY